ncbi:SAM-dependent methyltransferase [Kutzneria sp. NPDC051319]|uniref:SAM-dependent methyltransferase n=1 Tax=Kutzneria sp. NPDC051319 TaxID=3155047 RepID=UPI00343BF541
MTLHQPERFLPQGADLTHPSVARVYDWYLGGTNNWAIDREFGKRVCERVPLIKDIARANRQFLFRAVRHLMAMGVRQFIDIGAGLPTMRPTHEVADEVEPGVSKVIYVDHEPVAVAESQVLLQSKGDPLRHAALNGDLRAPDRLWAQIEDLGIIDFTEPVALLLIAVLHVEQTDEGGRDLGQEAVARYRALLPSGSYLVISHISDEDVPADMVAQLVELKAMYDKSSSRVIWRSRQQVRELFGDFELIEPGLQWTPDWHPEDADPQAEPISFATPAHSVIRAAAARKP